MGSSNNNDNKDPPQLTLVGGLQADAMDLLPEGVDPSTIDRATLQQLADLKRQHRELDEEIQALVTSAASDQLLLKRLKKRKLMLKDQITRLESELIPDLNA